METTKSITIDTPIKEIRFTRNNTRIQNCFFYNDVKTVGDLVKLTRDELKKFRDLGPVCINIIEDWLEHYGLSLGDGNFQSPADRLDLTPQDWEQRFYEVAKEILPKFIGTSELCDMYDAKEEEIDNAISYAYCFIQTLKDRSELYIEGGDWK